METKKMGQSNVVITLHRPLTAEERLKFGVRPYIGKNTYIVPNARLDELTAHLNSHQGGSTNTAYKSNDDLWGDENNDAQDNQGQSEQEQNEQEQETQAPKQVGSKDAEQDKDAESNDKPSEQNGGQQDNQDNQQQNQQQEQQNQQQQQEQEQEQQQEQEQEQDNSIKHEKFDAVMKILQAGEAVYLYGEAGTGKNHLCSAVAKALGVKFYFTNCVQDVFQLKGFVDAKGEYQKTQLYQAYTEGGLFMLDEMDASDPSALITMNALLANGYMEFPGHTERVFPHPKFKVIACGNTVGKGADELYTGRLVLDGASLDRFTIVPVDYDERVEMAIANGNSALVQFCRKLRNVAKEMQYNTIISYRTISRLSKYIKIFSTKEALQYGFANAIAEDDARALSGAFANAKDEFGKEFYKMYKM